MKHSLIPNDEITDAKNNPVVIVKLLVNTKRDPTGVSPKKQLCLVKIFVSNEVEVQAVVGGGRHGTDSRPRRWKWFCTSACTQEDIHMSLKRHC